MFGPHLLYTNLKTWIVNYTRMFTVIRIIIQNAFWETEIETIFSHEIGNVWTFIFLITLNLRKLTPNMYSLSVFFIISDFLNQIFDFPFLNIVNLKTNQDGNRAISSIYKLLFSIRIAVVHTYLATTRKRLDGLVPDYWWRLFSTRSWKQKHRRNVHCNSNLSGGQNSISLRPEASPNSARHLHGPYWVDCCWPVWTRGASVLALWGWRLWLCVSTAPRGRPSPQSGRQIMSGLRYSAHLLNAATFPLDGALHRFILTNIRGARKRSINSDS